MRGIRYWFCVVALAVVMGGCANMKENASFRMRPREARTEWREMEARPVRLKRPLVVVGGFREQGIPTALLAGAFRRMFDGEMVEGVPMTGVEDFDECVEKVLAAVEERWPSRREGETVEVDVVGISMGGLVARYAAMVHEGRKRLRVHRLYTISTPHRGARLAVLPTTSRLQREMRAGSEFLRKLAGAKRGYEIVPYVRLGDQEVGPGNAAPEGEVAWWVPYPVIFTAHNLAFNDPRIRLDIARRLREETPLGTEPRAGLPGGR